MTLEHSVWGRHLQGILRVGVICVVGIAASAAVGEDNSANAKAPFRFVSAAKHEQLRKMMPKVDDAATQAMLEDEGILFYTKDEMPKAHQDWGSGLPGIHSPQHNISAGTAEPYGNGNVEFPWGTAGGIHRSANVDSFHFMLLPRDEEGRTRSVVWYRHLQSGDSQQGYSWIFPVGTVFGEGLTLRGPDGRNHVFELRLRFRELTQWKVDVFRPFRSPTELAGRIRKERPDWEKHEKLVRLVSHLEEPASSALVRKRLADNHPSPVFSASAGVDALPECGDDALVAKLLKETTFVSVLGHPWRNAGDELLSHAPTTDAAFHIVPARYDGGFIEVSSDACMKCHDTVNRNVRDFDYGRDWYGHIRGSDGIFSFHPFDPSCISYNGASQAAMLNGRLIAAGILEPFQPTKHSREIYQRVRGLD